MAGARTLTVDLDLLRKYALLDLLAPPSRTAPHFHTGVGAEAFRDATLAANAAADPFDLSLYLHFPFCPSLCAFCGCTVEVTRDPVRVADYLADLQQEIALLATITKPGRRVVQMRWGGGTPTFLATAQLRSVFRELRRHFAFAPDAEIGIEVDPRGLGPDHLDALRELGFNDVTFGVQDLDPQVQRAVGREQPEEMTRAVVERSRALGFPSVGVDLIYGLPYQTCESLEVTLRRVAGLAPDRVTVFGYGHIPRLKPHQRVLESLPMPGFHERLAMFKTTVETLTGSGYVYLGMDYFVKPGDRLARALEEGSLQRNVQGYGTCARADVHGLGLTAISQLPRMYAQNSRRMADYQAAVRSARMPTSVGCRLDDDDLLRGVLATQVLCSRPIDKGDLERRCQVAFDACFSDASPRLGELASDGLVDITGGRMVVTEKGRPFVRTIASSFGRRVRV